MGDSCIKLRKRYRLKKKFKYFFIAYFFVVVFVTTQYSLAKFNTNVYKNSSVSVARPVAKLISSDIDKISFVSNGSNYEATYSFSITNAIDGKINEVDLKYFINITIGDEFSYYLYKNSLSDDNLISDVNNYYGELGHDKEEVDKYILKIVYVPKNNTKSYETDLNVDVSYVQVQ